MSAVPDISLSPTHSELDAEEAMEVQQDGELYANLPPAVPDPALPAPYQEPGEDDLARAAAIVLDGERVVAAPAHVPHRPSMAEHVRRRLGTGSPLALAEQQAAPALGRGRPTSTPPAVAVLDRRGESHRSPLLLNGRPRPVTGQRTADERRRDEPARQPERRRRRTHRGQRANERHQRARADRREEERDRRAMRLMNYFIANYQR